MAPLLEIRDLRVHFRTRDGIVKAVDGASLALDRGQMIGVVGESGSGKSVTALTTIGLTRFGNAEIGGEVLFDGIDLLKTPTRDLRKVRGKRIAMIFQDPLSSLHPFYKAGWQIVEAIREHEQVSRTEARERAVKALASVGIPNPERRVDAFPHELSGGMRQRVMIAMALVLRPDMLIADEPTTALDVTVQAQILELISELRENFGTAVMLITHDLGVVAETCDDVAVMYAGRIVERASREALFTTPEMPYTWGLLRSLPLLGGARQKRLQPIQGMPPSLIRVPPGCPFHPRCPHRMDVCSREVPGLLPAEPEHLVACHLPHEERRRIGQELQAERALAS